jgi:hypothetical protein
VEPAYPVGPLSGRESFRLHAPDTVTDHVRLLLDLASEQCWVRGSQLLASGASSYAGALSFVLTFWSAARDWLRAREPGRAPTSCPCHWCRAKGPACSDIGWPASQARACWPGALGWSYSLRDYLADVAWRFQER